MKSRWQIRMYTDSEFSRYQCDCDSNLHPHPTLTIKTPIYLPTEGRCNGPCATRHSCWWVVGTNTLYIHTCLMFTRTLCILVRCSMCRHAGEVCVCVCVCVCGWVLQRAFHLQHSSAQLPGTLAQVTPSNSQLLQTPNPSG